MIAVPNKHAIGLAVKSLRLAAGYTLADLEKATGITLTSLSRTETGNRDLGFGEAVILTRALHSDLGALLELARSLKQTAVRKAYLRRKLSDISRELKS